MSEKRVAFANYTPGSVSLLYDAGPNLWTSVPRVAVTGTIGGTADEVIVGHGDSATIKIGGTAGGILATKLRAVESKDATKQVGSVYQITAKPKQRWVLGSQPAPPVYQNYMLWSLIVVAAIFVIALILAIIFGRNNKRKSAK